MTSGPLESDERRECASCGDEFDPVVYDDPESATQCMECSFNDGFSDFEEGYKPSWPD